MLPSPTPRRHRYLDSGPQPVVDETVAADPAPRRHRYRGDGDGEGVQPADSRRETPVRRNHQQDRPDPRS